MAEQRITIEIDEDGKITAKTAGFYGEACLDALQDLLGMEDIPVTIKPSDDYYQHRRLTADETIRQKGRRT